MRPLALLLCLLLPACGHLKKRGVKVHKSDRETELKKLTEASVSEASSRLGEKAVGEVIMVSDSGYVLLRGRNGVTLDEGQELLCEGSGAARLKVTPERNSKMFLFAADIVSGSPQTGDSVVPVKGRGKPVPKLVPVVSHSLPGTTAPEGTLNLDPNAIRPEDLPRSTLDEPGDAPPSLAPALSPADDPGNLLVEPPLPERP